MVCTGTLVIICSHKHTFYQVQWNQAETSVASCSLPVVGKFSVHQRAWHAFMDGMGMSPRVVSFMPALSSLVVFSIGEVSKCARVSTAQHSNKLLFLCQQVWIPQTQTAKFIWWEAFLKGGNYDGLFLFKNRLKGFWRIMFLALPTFAIPVTKSTVPSGCTQAIYGVPCRRLPETCANKKLFYPGAGRCNAIPYLNML